MKQNTFETISENILEQLLLEYARSRSINGSTQLQAMLEKIMLRISDRVIDKNYKKIAEDLDSQFDKKKLLEKIENEIITKMQESYKKIDIREMIKKRIDEKITEILPQKADFLTALEKYIQSLVKGVEVERTWRGTKVVIEFY